VEFADFVAAPVTASPGDRETAAPRRDPEPSSREAPGKEIRTPGNGDRWADFWVAPRSGGTARRVGEVTGDLAEVERIGVTADAVVWSVRGGGVHRLPLAGGAPERIAGADGLHLMSWPWAVDVETGEEAGGGDGENARTCRTDRPEDPSGPAGASAHPEGGVSCSTTQKGGGKTFTVVNLLAVPKTE
jgi:hypothetical protein